MNTVLRFFCIRITVLILLVLSFSGGLVHAQSLATFSSSPPAGSSTNWLIGAKIGLSLASGGGSTSAGLTLGPMGEVIFGKNLAVGTELNINTQSGTPIEWSDYFKMYFIIPGSSVKPYANIGMSLWFVTGGPYFGLRFGGGANFRVSQNIYIPADIQLGPVFFSEKDGFGNSKTNTIFYVGITTGIRYEIP
jgi:hypothetical protein